MTSAFRREALLAWRNDLASEEIVEEDYKLALAAIIFRGDDASDGSLFELNDTLRAEMKLWRADVKEGIFDAADLDVARLSIMSRLAGREIQYTTLLSAAGAAQTGGQTYCTVDFEQERIFVRITSLELPLCSCRRRDGSSGSCSGRTGSCTGRNSSQGTGCRGGKAAKDED